MTRDAISVVFVEPRLARLLRRPPRQAEDVGTRSVLATGVDTSIEPRR